MIFIKNKLFIILILLCNSVYGQKHIITSKINLGYSGFTSSNINLSNNLNAKKIDINFADDIILNIHFSAGASLGISKLIGSFRNPYLNSAIPEVIINYRHSLNLTSINLPINIKYRTNKSYFLGYHFYYGIVLNYAVNNYRNIDIVVDYQFVPDKQDVSNVNKGNFKFSNSLYLNHQLGIEKFFKIRNKLFVWNLELNADLFNNKYFTVNDIDNKYIYLKKSGINVGFGKKL